MFVLLCTGRVFQKGKITAGRFLFHYHTIANKICNVQNL